MLALNIEKSLKVNGKRRRLHWTIDYNIRELFGRAFEASKMSSI